MMSPALIRRGSSPDCSGAVPLSRGSCEHGKDCQSGKQRLRVHTLSSSISPPQSNYKIMSTSLKCVGEFVKTLDIGLKV